MTAKNHLHTLAVVLAAALALISDTAKAARTATVQTRMHYSASDPDAASKLTALTVIPNGAEIDARKGRVLLSVLHDARGRLGGARFYAGRFVFSQGKGDR